MTGFNAICNGDRTCAHISLISFSAPGERSPLFPSTQFSVHFQRWLGRAPTARGWDWSSACGRPAEARRHNRRMLLKNNSRNFAAAAAAAAAATAVAPSGGMRAHYCDTEMTDAEKRYCRVARTTQWRRIRPSPVCSDDREKMSFITRSLKASSSHAV